MILMKAHMIRSICIGLTLAVVPLLGSAAPPVGASPPGMTRASRQGEKIGAPVDMFYKYVAGGTAKNDPTLQLAFAPRLAVDNLRVELLAGPGAVIDNGGAPLALAKTSAAGVYNRYISVRRLTDKPATLQAIVTVDIGDSRYASIFTLPVDAASATAMKSTTVTKPSRKQPLR